MASDTPKKRKYYLRNKAFFWSLNGLTTGNNENREQNENPTKIQLDPQV
ncbi:hypothetical protein ACOCEA_03545 [Maribacter sp. CXY002]